MSFKKTSIPAPTKLDTVSRSPFYEGLLSFESIMDGPAGLNTRFMKYRLPCYLHTLRRRRALSQPEVAALLAITASALSRFEKRSRKPTAELIVATEVMFGHSVKEVFPAFYHAVQCEILRRVGHRLKMLEAKSDQASQLRFRFFTEIMERAGQTNLDV